ncbi:4Fe-4S binding protein [Spongiimicrobium sp. 3-5]|uniref:4Fe-4S binding protein n=1 Tax=Spongiimicrobium sp. 3-5 TaxID=3332596 RepID=UPI00397EE76C
MKEQKYIVVNGNQAAAQVAYKVNEVCAIYPITPSSEMSELAAEWSANQQRNVFGDVPSIFEMQSEAGVAGALHGALQTGSLATTFTASQGLLLMMPNMYKIAGELTPNVIHVATRSVATHALSVFGDHSDIMAVRNTGYAFLGAASVQEAMDFALIAQAATLESRIPFVHFFDGFRTSHETSKIENLPNAVIKEMMNTDHIQAHRDNALNPNKPVLRGTAQGADVFFQSREASNTYYNACPDLVQKQMDKFSELTGRSYQIFEYVGHPKAEQVLIAMASATETIEKTIKYLNAKGEKIGLIKVRLFRPFSADHLVKALPKSCKSIAVLDRTKEPGSTGEPLYLDVVQSVTALINSFDQFPKIVGGRYGLSSKELTPAMILSVVNNLKKEHPKNNFTIGINDDVTHLSLDYEQDIDVKDKNYKALFYETRSVDATTSFGNTLQYLGALDNTFVQGYTECDYRKSRSRSVSNLRISKTPIRAPYLVSDADFVVCDSVNFVENDDVIKRIKFGGRLLVASELPNQEFWNQLSIERKQELVAKEILVYTIDSKKIVPEYFSENYTISSLHACFFALNEKISLDQAFQKLQNHITKVDLFLGTQINGSNTLRINNFENTLIEALIAGRGGELPVSALPADGTFQTGTSEFNEVYHGLEIPEWDQDLCTHCGACSMACPQGALRIKVYDDNVLMQAPSGFKNTMALDPEWAVDLLNYTIQIDADQCTSCNNCVDACPAKALTMINKTVAHKVKWDYFKNIPEMDRSKIDVSMVSRQQLQEPLFKYSSGVDGCGEAPYLKLLSQLFGDRMLVANATGASSIFGGALPTTPWTKNAEGKGPAWSNSLFEDNAEFGLGFRLTLEQQEMRTKNLLKRCMNPLEFDLVYNILNAPQNTETEIEAQRARIAELKYKLTTNPSKEAQELLKLSDSLIKQSVWIVGGDGWAYDIGYGGIDHVIASGKNVNILVLDNEVYSNTGGQNSKATPYGASAKFEINGKQKQKKDLGLLAMCYDDVYVASVAMGADQEHTLKTFLEAESYDGPSIIIAYCHSPAHGIDMKNPSQYHKAAVDSGQWLLYRNDPRRTVRGLNPLQLDSERPSIGMHDYLRGEKRFEKFLGYEDEATNMRITEIQRKVDQRFKRYARMASQMLSLSEK